MLAEVLNYLTHFENLSEVGGIIKRKIENVDIKALQYIIMRYHHRL